MKIILVRHGESEHNAGLVQGLDTNLTKKGENQARRLGKKLKKEKISEIYTSNLKRAKQTARIISKEINVPVKEGFKELGEYSFKHLTSKLKGIFSARRKKLKIFLKEIIKNRERDKTILIVAHGRTNRIIMGSLLEIPIKKQLMFLQQHNTCVNLISWDNHYKNWVLESMNDLSHIPKELK